MRSEALIKAAYGPNDESIRLLSSLDVVARALNEGDLPRAMIAAVLARVPELEWEQAARLASTEDRLAKYSPDQPRDWHGRWTTEGNAVAANASSAASPSSSDQVGHQGAAGLPNLQDFGSLDDATDRELQLTLTAFTPQEDALNIDESDDADAPQTAFEREYDDLGPVKFSKKAIEFGDWLERHGQDLKPDEQADARARYDFLQDRLLFWSGYPYKPAMASANLRTAALALYSGGVNSGLVTVGDDHGIAPSLLLAAAGIDDDQPVVPFRVPETESPVEAKPFNPSGPWSRVGQVGGIFDNKEIGIVWGKGIKEQGIPWQKYLTKVIPDARSCGRI